MNNSVLQFLAHYWIHVSHINTNSYSQIYRSFSFPLMEVVYKNYMLKCIPKISLTNILHDSHFIAKCGKSFLQNALTFLLQNVTSKWQNVIILLQNLSYYKLVTFITKCVGTIPYPDTAILVSAHAKLPRNSLIEICCW